MTDTGCILATMDEELGKIGPVPSGCCENPGSPATGLRRWGGNPAILHSRPRRWTRHSLRARLRLAGFSLAAPPAGVV